MPVAAAELEKEYKLVHGDPQNVDGILNVADLHVHVHGDITDFPRRILATAAQRLDVVAITNHDADGYDAASRWRDRTGSDLNIVRGAEMTTRPVDDKVKTHTGKHLLVYNFTHLPPGGMDGGRPIEEIVQEIDSQGGLVSVAHPTLADMSYSEGEIHTMVVDRGYPLLLEVHNGGGALIDGLKPWFAAHQNLPGVGFINRRVPEAGSNQTAKIIYEEYSSRLLGATGGSDAHSARQVGSVVTVFPSTMDVFSAIREGKSAVLQKRRLPRATATNAVVGTLGGKLLERKRRHNKRNAY